MKQENPAFVAFDNTIEGLVYNDIAHPRFPIKYYNVHSRLPELYGSCSYYGYVYGGYYSVLPKSKVFEDGEFGKSWNPA